MHSKATCVQADQKDVHAIVQHQCLSRFLKLTLSVVLREHRSFKILANILLILLPNFPFIDEPFRFRYRMADNVARFDNQADYTAMLTRIGVPVRERDHLVSDGFLTMKQITDYFQYSSVFEIEEYFKDINKTFGSRPRANDRVYFNPRVTKLLVASIWYFVHCVYSFHIMPDIDSLTLAKATQLDLACSQHKTSSNSTDSESKEDDDVVLPKLKGSINWIDFRDKFLIKLAKLRNKRNISLSYLVNNHPRQANHGNANYVQIGEIDFETPDLFLNQTIHFGPTYKSDNKRLWSLMENALVNTSPYNHISPFERNRDGRRAWSALKTYFEGEDFVQRTQDQAMATLSNTYYRGETKYFKFEDYVNAHLTAHKKLLQVGYNGGAGMDEATKVHHFKHNILPAAELEGAISLARLKERESFTVYVAFLSTEVDFRTARKKQMNKTAKDRNVSGMKSTDSSKRKSNQSKKKPANLGPVLYETVNGKRLESKIYSRAEFAQLSKEQRDAVIKLNRQRRYKARNDGSSNRSRNTSGIEVFRDEMTTIGDAIVAGVSRAVSERTDDDRTISSQQASPSSRPAASSGSVGDFIANLRKRKEPSS